MLKLENKRLFIGLQVIALLVLAGLFLLMWLLYTNQLGVIYRAFFLSIFVAAMVVIILVCLGMGGIVLTIFSKKTYQPLQNLMKISVEILYPIVLRIAHIFKIDIDKVRRSFIEVNNHLVSTDVNRVPADKLLVLAPHCLQSSECKYKVTYDVNNCKQCGKCTIGTLKKISDIEKVKVSVCTGGTMARMAVKEHKPSAIVAIACERDLTSGIQDIAGLPVLGLINNRPLGPCNNTQVDISQLIRCIKIFTGGND